MTSLEPQMDSRSQRLILYLPAVSSPVQKEVSITALRIPSLKAIPQRLRMLEESTNEGEKGLRDNEPTKVLEHDCVGATWLIFICPSRAGLCVVNETFLLWRDFHADRLFVISPSTDDFSP